MGHTPQEVVSTLQQYQLKTQKLSKEDAIFVNKIIGAFNAGKSISLGERNKLGGMYKTLYGSWPFSKEPQQTNSDYPTEDEVAEIMNWKEILDAVQSIDFSSEKMFLSDKESAFIENCAKRLHAGIGLSTKMKQWLLSIYNTKVNRDEEETT